MKQRIEVLVGLLVLLVLAACVNIAAPTPTVVQVPEVTSTRVPLTATASMSAEFATFLAPEVTYPVSTVFGATPLPVTGTPQPLATDDPNYIEQEHIRNVIRTYFDLRHKSFSTLRLESFDGLLSRRPDAIAFWERESSKLRFQLKDAELSGGRFVKYEYFLSDEKMFIDAAGTAATIFVSLRHNVIYEISALLTPGEPIVSSMSGEDHVIGLQKEGGEWKIISDTYNDYLWRMAGNSGTFFEDRLQLMEAQPTPTPSCFVGIPLAVSFPVETPTPSAASIVSPRVKAVYLNGKSYEPEWLYPYPFTNLFLEPDGESLLRFMVEIDPPVFLTERTASQWQIVIQPHTPDSTSPDKPTFVLNNLVTTQCGSRAALQVETSMEEIQSELGNHRAFDYQVLDEKGEVKLEHTFYLNPPNSFFISDAFAEIDTLDNGVIGYPNRMDESKTIFPRTGQAILVREPRGGFFQLHYFVHTFNLDLPSGVWEEKTSDEVVVQISSYREHGLYGPDNVYILPDERKIRWPKNYDFEIYFTIEELREALGEGNEFYMQFLDREGNNLGTEYIYFLPYSSTNP